MQIPGDWWVGVDGGTKELLFTRRDGVERTPMIISVEISARARGGGLPSCLMRG